MTSSAALAKKRVEEIVSFFGINADVELNETEEGILLDVKAAESTPRLIGHHGETLRAIEFLVNQMLKTADSEAPRVSVDIAGYKLARQVALEEYARDIASKVIANGEEIELKPMNAAERRIVHMALRDLPNISTESRGEEKSRRIIVLPSKTEA